MATNNSTDISLGSTKLSTSGITPVLTPDFFNTADYQIQLKENFVVVFEKTDFLDGFELICESVTLPQRQIEQIAVPYANKNINIAGRNTFTNMTLVVRDVIKKDTEAQITNWMERILQLRTGIRGQIGNENGKEGYKTNVEVIPLSPNGDYGRPSIARGCFPVNIDWGNLSYTETGIRTITIELSVDDYGRRELWDESIR